MKNKVLEFEVIDKIKCYSPKKAFDYENYPDGGFELTDLNSKHSFWVTSRNRIFKEFIRLNSVRGKKNYFLEIGCATGDLIEYISDIGDLEITGSEIYVNGLVYAKKKLPSIEFIQYDVTEGVIEKNFDLIVAFDVIEHIDDDIAALTHIFSMLNEGGVLIISVPQYQFLFGNLDKIVCHKRRYSKRDLVEKLKKVGFQVKYSTSFVFALFPLMLISRIFDRKIDSRISSKDALGKKAKFNPITNKICNIVMQFDELLIKWGFSLPFGGTLIVVVNK